MQQHPSVVLNAVAALLQFIIHNNPPVEYGSVLHEYLATMSSSSPIGDALQNCLCQKISSGQNQALTESVLRTVIVQRAASDLKRVAAVMESALENYDGSRESLMKIFAGEVRADLISVCWNENCLLSWYCLVCNRDSAPGSDNLFILEHLLTGCKSLILR